VRNFRFTAHVSLLFVASTTGTAYGQWPQFRGPNGSGVDSAGPYPVAFSPSKDVVWKTSVPYGQSSPVLASDRMYLTASEGGRLLTIALDAASGRELWRREIQPPRSHKIYKANDPASPTPVADENGVVVFFADFGLAAYTPEGKDQWTVPLGPFKSFYGMAASPIIADDLVILVCDQQSGSFVVAVDRRTGRERWKKERPGAVDGYATPMVFRPAGSSPLLIVLGSTGVDAYAADTGERRWWMPLGSSGAMGTVVARGDTLYVSTTGSTEPWLPTFTAALQKHDSDKDGRISAQEFAQDKEMAEHFGFFDHDADSFVNAQEWAIMRAYGIGEFGAMAIRPGDARGKLDAKAVLWRFTKNLPYIPAPLLYNDVLYLVKDGGIITALDAATGRVLKQERSPNAPGQYHASPVAADGKVFLANTEGTITVLKAGPQWNVLGVNDIGEEIHATPALGGGRIYVRTRRAVYAFGARSSGGQP
jgi:outer membrane protein assembly factor BamB